MFGLREHKNFDAPRAVDEIENAVYTQLRPCGFRKYGRTLHRFVSGDISQVIHFQTYTVEKSVCAFLFVNIGVRLPECAERVFQTESEKKYYHEYECTIRTRLKSGFGGVERKYDLSRDTAKITRDILKKLRRIVLPAFDVLNSRENILLHRRDYPQIDDFSGKMVLLDECMIYGRLGNLEKAKACFERYYRAVVQDYKDSVQHGTKIYLKKGEHILFREQRIDAEKNGYVTIYGANRCHIDYLDALAEKLGLR